MSKGLFLTNGLPRRNFYSLLYRIFVKKENVGANVNAPKEAVIDEVSRYL